MTNEKKLTKEDIGVNREDAPLNLTKVREAKGLTLQDINAATKITIANLDAIEKGIFHRLPEPIYARNFMKSYARMLGMDAQPLLRQYDSYLNTLNKSLSVPESEAERNKKKETAKDGRSGHTRTGIRNLALVLAAFILIGGVIFFVSDRNTPNPPLREEKTAGGPQQPLPAPPAPPSGGEPATSAGQQVATASAPAAMPAQQVPASVGPAAQGKTGVTASIAPGSIPTAPGQAKETSAPPWRLKISATEKTWLRITTDGRNPEQLMMQKGDSVERTAGEAFLIDIGNAAGVQVWFQGQQLPMQGKQGEVKHLKLP